MTKKSVVEVSQINIKIGKKEIQLSLEEAMELRSLLNETLGNGETTKITYIPGSPIYIPRPYPLPRPYWSVTWNDTSSTGSGTLTYSLSSNNITEGIFEDHKEAWDKLAKR